MKSNLIVLSIFMLSLVLALAGDAKQPDKNLDIVFAKGGVYSIRVVRDPSLTEADSLEPHSQTEILRHPDKADSHMLFSPLTDYADIYGDSCKAERNFETVQVLEGVVHNTDGRESIEVLALNCKTGHIFRTYADKSGRFAINVNEFVDSTVFNVDAYDKLDKRIRYDLSLTEPALPLIPARVKQSKNNATGYFEFDSARVLKNIEVTGKRREAMNRFKIEPTKGYFEGDPAIYRHTNIMSLLKTMGVNNVKGATILLDNEIIQRSTDTDEDYTLDPDIENYLNSLSINEIWQVEYIRNDPRTMMFQSAQKGAPVILIYTKFGSGGPRALRRTVANSFTPMGYEHNIVSQTVKNDGNLILWHPELVVRSGEKLTVEISDKDLQSMLTISVKGITEQGEYVECEYVVL